MRKLTRGVILLLVIAFAAPACAWSVSPCDCVDRGLTDKSKAEWAVAIARQLRAQKVDVLQSFRLEGWTIIYVDSHADEAFLFYSRDPLRGRYVAMWSGAAARNEEEHIRAWTLKNAPGIPQKLADCFAWYVTKGRTK